MRRGDKTPRRRAHHPRTGNKKGDGRQWKTTRGDKTLGRRATIQHKRILWGDNGRQWQTVGDNGRQGGTELGKAGACKGRQWETMAGQGETREGRHTITGTHVGSNGRKKRGNKTSGRRSHHPTQAHVWANNGRQWEAIGSMGDKGRQELGKVDTPSNTGRQGETRPREGIHTIQNMQGDNGRQNGEIRRREGGRTTQHRQTRQDTIQHRHTCGETIGNKKGRQDVDKADPPSNTGTCVGRQWETMGLMGEKGRQDVRKAGTPSNTGTHVGRQ